MIGGDSEPVNDHNWVGILTKFCQHPWIKLDALGIHIYMCISIYKHFCDIGHVTLCQADCAKIISDSCTFPSWLKSIVQEFVLIPVFFQSDFKWIVCKFVLIPVLFQTDLSGTYGNLLWFLYFSKLIEVDFAGICFESCNFPVTWR